MFKSKDTLLLGLLIIVVAAISYVVTNSLFGTKNLVTKVEVVEPISADFNYLDKPYFTKDAINPTKDITINENNNLTPLTQ